MLSFMWCPYCRRSWKNGPPEPSPDSTEFGRKIRELAAIAVEVMFAGFVSAPLFVTLIVFAPMLAGV